MGKILCIIIVGHRWFSPEAFQEIQKLTFYVKCSVVDVTYVGSSFIGFTYHKPLVAMGKHIVYTLLGLGWFPQSPSKN